MPAKNHNKNPHTTKKSAVTMVDRTLRMISLMPVPSSSDKSPPPAAEVPPCSSFMRLASSNSRSKESPSPSDAVFDVSGVDGEEEAVVVDIPMEAVLGLVWDDATSVSCGRMTFLISSCTGVSSLGLRSIVSAVEA